MDESMRRELSRQITGLREPRQQGDGDFARSLTELDAFLREHRKLPDWRSKEPSEARLGSWLRTQQAVEHSGALSGERRAKLRELIGPGWATMR